MRAIGIIFCTAVFSSLAFGQSVSQRAETIKKESAAITKKCPNLLQSLKDCKDAENFKQCIKDVKDKCKKESNDSGNAIKDGGKGIQGLIK